MKNYFNVFLVLMILWGTSCEKNDATKLTAPANTNSPTCAYTSYEQRGGQFHYFLNFFDLSSTNTADKKYFKMQLKFVGVKDSFEIEGIPQSINNLGSNFPAEITTAPGYGLVNQWTNPQYRVLNTGLGFYKDTIVRNPASNIYFLHLNYLSGSLAGKWPQSNFDNYNVPTGVNGQSRLHFRTIFYFEQGLCLDANNFEQYTTLKPISALYSGAPNYDWTNVGSGLQIVSGGLNRFYFLDFKNWRYFRWTQFMNPIFTPAQLATTFEGYQSLDDLVKWPDGWGRK